MNDFLIAVSSCQRDRDAGIHDVIRETWGAAAEEAGIPHVFTIGSVPGLFGEGWMGPREYISGAGDDWLHLGHKTLTNVRLALSLDCAFMFQCFVDTYISIPRLIKARAELTHAVTGNYFFHGFEEGGPCGGAGYWLRRDAMEAVAREPLETLADANNSEDIWIGQIMRRNGFAHFHDSRYDHLSFRGGVKRDNSNITNHLFTHYCDWDKITGFDHFDPQWLRDEEKQELLGTETPHNIRRREAFPHP